MSRSSAPLRCAQNDRLMISQSAFARHGKVVLSTVQRRCGLCHFPPLSLVHRLRRFFQRIGWYQLHPLIRRTLITVVGTTIVLIGLLLIFLPGPGALVILVGLAVLGSEFVWARRLMRKARELGTQGRDYVKSLVTKS